MKSPLIKSLLQHRTAEAQVILLICSLAILRMVVALIVDFSGPVYSIPELLTDFSIFFLFVILLIIVQRNFSIKKVHSIYGVLIILLLGINFLQFGGVEGTNSFNYYAGIYVVVMLYSGWRLYTLVTLQLILLVILQALIHFNHPLYQQILIHITHSQTEFIFSLISITVFTFYLKGVTLSEITELESKNSEVRLRVRESKTLNHELVVQAKELKKAQKTLQEEVTQRAKAIEVQNEAIEQYIYHNTDTLKLSLQQLSKAMEQFKGETQLHLLMKLSHAELNQVVSGIHRTLQSEEKLDRGILLKNVHEKTD